jgi:TldD protein
MTDTDLPELSKLLPRELAAELLNLARAGGADFADLFAEHAIVTGFSLDERRVKTASYTVLQGVGVRAIRGEQTGYAYADGFAPDALREAARVAAVVARDAPPSATRADGSPVAFRASESAPPFVLHDPATLALDEPTKVAMLQRADEAARAHDPRVHEVSISLGTSAKSFLVANSDGVWAEDRTHLSRLVVSALALEGGQRQEGFGAAGGCVEASYYARERTPEAVAEEAASGAVLLLAAREPEAGSYPVVVCNGWGGVMVHECFGHSMEGDTIRRKTSIRATQMGQQVAARGVTIVDSGLVPYSRGSFRVDDEGTPAQRTELVRDGVLVGYLWDRLNARLTGSQPTGNGRRASYRDYPLCRMTNTVHRAGNGARRRADRGREARALQSWGAAR